MSEEHQFSEAQIELIAEKAAEKALQKIYAQVGQNIVRRFLWLVGTVVLSLAIWLAGRGSFK